MGEKNEKVMALTMYGKDDSVEAVSISLFDRINSYYSESKNNAKNYCKNINAIELKDNKWIYATIVEENEKIILCKPPKFDDIINKLDDNSLQKLLLEITRNDLAKALINTSEETMDKIIKNMSKRSAVILKEDMESFNRISKGDILSSREKIIEIIKNIPSEDELIIARVN